MKVQLIANLKFDLRFTKLEKLKARKKHFVFFYTAVNSYAEPLGTGRLSHFSGNADQQDRPEPRMSLSRAGLLLVCLPAVAFVMDHYGARGEHKETGVN